MQHAESAALWIDAVEVKIQKDGICCTHVRSGNVDIELRGTLDTLAQTMESMARAYTNYLCGEPIIVTRIGNARRRH